MSEEERGAKLVCLSLEAAKAEGYPGRELIF